MLNGIIVKHHFRGRYILKYLLLLKFEIGNVLINDFYRNEYQVA